MVHRIRPHSASAAVYLKPWYCPLENNGWVAWGLCRNFKRRCGAAAPQHFSKIRQSPHATHPCYYGAYMVHSAQSKAVLGAGAPVYRISW